MSKCTVTNGTYGCDLEDGHGADTPQGDNARVHHGHVWDHGVRKSTSFVSKYSEVVVWANPTPSVKKLEAEARAYKPQIEQLFKAFAYVAAKQPMPNDLSKAAEVAVDKGYFRYSARATRYMFTDEGKAFYKSMKKFSPMMKRVLG
jgi:hypothetical protein